MKQEDHEQKTLAIWGRKYTFIHEWLAQHFARFGPMHRIILHHQRGIELLIKAFPQEDPEMIEKVARRHIKDDHVWAKNTKQSPGQLVELMIRLYPDLF